jgi:hypothetical protein
MFTPLPVTTTYSASELAMSVLGAAAIVAVEMARVERRIDACARM